MNDVAQLPIGLVYPHSEARALNQSRVAMLSESIKEVGLLNPIIVRKAMKTRNGVKAEAWEILAGGHRYEACVMLKLETIPCVVMDTTDLLSELIAIDENLCRAELSPAEQAFQTARRKEIYEALHPETKQHVAGGKARQDSASDKLSFAAQTSRATGRDKRTVERDAARGEALGDDLKRVANTSLDKGVEIDALAKLDKPAREEIIKKAEKGEKVSARDCREAEDRRRKVESHIKNTDRVIALSAAEEFAGWLMARTDLHEMPTIISWLEGTKAKDVIAAMRRVAA